jgi:hypothetical protein
VSATLTWESWKIHGEGVGISRLSRQRLMLTGVIVPYPTQAGQVGGHEGVGIIHKLGPGSENGRVKVGDRVGIKASLLMR